MYLADTLQVRPAPDMSNICIVLLLQLLAASVKQLRQQEQQARGSGTGSLQPAYPFEDGSSTAAAANPFMSEGGDEPSADNMGYPDYPASANGAGSFWNSSQQGSSAGGGSSNGPAWGASKPPLQQQQHQQQGLGGMQGKQGGWNWDAGGLGQGSGGGSAGGFGTRDEQFGSLHDTGQVSCVCCTSHMYCLLTLARFAWC